ncbi:hypothetical protein BCC1697_000839 [Burkholderia gladioli]
MSGRSQRVKNNELDSAVVFNHANHIGCDT